MKAIILAGGRGERLMPLTADRPKPALPILDKPMIAYVVELLREHGIRDIAVTLGYMPEVIISLLGDGRAYGANLHYFIEDRPLGTAGSIKNAAEFIDGDFLVVSGDTYSEIDLSQFAEAHRIGGKIATVCIKEVDNVKGFGVVKTAQDGLITEFVEKPEFSTERWINTGIYAFKPSILKRIPEGKYDFGRDLFPKLLGEMNSYKTDAYWSDVGTLTSYYNTNLYLSGTAVRPTM